MSAPSKEFTDEFLHRDVSISADFTDDEGETFRVTVSRTRTSHLFSRITLKVGKDQIDFDGDDEDVIRKTAEMLVAIANNKCTLPKVES